MRIVTRKEYWEIDSPYRKSRYGPNKTKQWKQEDIVFILCRLDEVWKRCPKWCFTDKHANSPHVNFYTRLGGYGSFGLECDR